MVRLVLTALLVALGTACGLATQFTELSWKAKLAAVIVTSVCAGITAVLQRMKLPTQPLKKKSQMSQFVSQEAPLMETPTPPLKKKPQVFQVVKHVPPLQFTKAFKMSHVGHLDLRP